MSEHSPVRDRFDSDGNPVTLDRLCKLDPEWAASRIRYYEARADLVPKVDDELVWKIIGTTMGHADDFAGMDQKHLDAAERVLNILTEHLGGER